ncbi:MAG: glycosyltransferase family 2 protein [Verrucomicrobiia bacterium]
MKISVCIITLNEEKNLSRCLISAKPVADEIIVLDSGSVDKTEIIAKSFGAKFHLKEWQGYVGQKNAAICLASYDWVLSLDADEALSERLVAEIESEKSKVQPEPLSGFSMPRCVFYEGKWIRHGDWYPDRVVRLFRKSRGKFVGGKVHERLELAGNIGKFYGDILHYSFENEEAHIQKIHKYARLWAESAFESGIKSTSISPYSRAAFRWFRGFILRLGFLDGKQGAKIAKLCALETFLKYKYLKCLWEGKPIQDSIR